jgi:ribosome biogenesis GTPase
VKLENIGWSDRENSLFDQFNSDDINPGRVVRVDRGLIIVETGTSAVAAVVAGRLDPVGDPGPPAVGDWVALDCTSDTPVVRAILPRAGALNRRRPGDADRAQAVAANVDLVLVVESVERGPNARRIERAVALAWDAGATPVVVVTKIDQVETPSEATEKARDGAPFCEIVPISSTTGQGMEPLEAILTRGTTAVLLGPSGVGKSTLANRLLGDERLAVSHVRSGDAKGRHTTTHRELVVLPSGACLIDTPGIRELGLWLGAEAIDSAFPEIEEAAESCRFRDCRHNDEPGCEVIARLEGGEIDRSRLDSYHRLQREAEHLEQRLDPSRKHEIRARERGFGKMIRQTLKIKNKR